MNKRTSDKLIPKFQTAIRSMREGKFGLSIPVDLNDEVGKLGHELNGLAQELERKFDEAIKIREISEEITAGMFLDGVLNRAFQSFHSVIPYNRMGCALLSDESKEATAYWAKTDTSIISLKVGHTAAMAGSSLQQIIKTGQPRILNDLEAYLAEHPASDSTKLIVEEGIRSSLTCPLIAQGKPVGFLFFSSREKNTYQDIHQDIFLQIAGQISILIEKGRLYQQLYELNQSLILARRREGESERHFRAITESANDAFITGAGTGNIVDWNAAAERMFGYTKAEAIGQPLTMLIPERFRNLHSEGLARVVAGGTPHLIGKTAEVIGLRKDGSEFPLEMSLSKWQTADGQFFNAIIRDITERKQVEEEFRVAATAFESQEGMMVTDAHNVILRVNHAFTEITGYTAEEAVGQTPRLLKSGRQDAAFYTALWESIQRTGSWHGVVWNRRKNGEVYPEQLTITAVNGDTGETTHYVSTMHDITERMAAEEKINNLAFYDTLTQIPNRRMLNDRLGQSLAASKRSGLYGALMFLDLDNFKPLNDTHGHGVGDLLLIEVAHRLTRCVREVDTVARFGGDEFVVMLTELDADKAKSTAQAGIVAEKIRRALAEPYMLKIHQEGNAETAIEHHSAASIGVVVFNSKASAEDIFRWADIAMYHAKDAGRNLIRVYDSTA